MAKMRVSELAKELEIQSKDIIGYLGEYGFEIKSHSSNLDERQISMIRGRFGDFAKLETAKKEDAEKKPVKKTEAKTEAKAKPVAEKKTVKAEAVPAEKKAEPVEEPAEKKEETKAPVEKKEEPARINILGNVYVQQAERQAAKAAAQAQREANRPQGERRYGDRPQGNRPQGERRYGDRPQGERRYGDRPQGDRPQGERRYGDRPQGNRPQGGMGGRPQSGGFNKDRFFDKDADKDSVQQKRPAARGRNDARNGAASSIKADFANELTKEQRVAAFSHRDRDKEREKKKDREMDESSMEKMLKKKDPNRKGAFIKPEVVKPVEEEIKSIVVPDVITIKELADKLKQPASALVKKLFLAGKMVSINQEITFEEAEEIALEYDCIAEKEVKVNVVEELLKEAEEDESLMVKRPPVVCVMGHVDHGKTSLLDAIREANVTAKEAGGITQHIGAYTVEVNGEHITFLDTPGHEAFTSMRMRGAKSTDIAILVVAADDGVMPQTVEAINHAKAAGIQIIVAVNKIDKPSANVERVKQELTEYELVAEDWGGDTIFVPVSAHTKEGITQLLEMVLLTAEMCELKANPNRKARGIVIEAQLDKGKGPVATILVQKGTLHVGDIVAIGSAYGKVRAMMDDKGRRVKEATPSTPVEILGLNEVPNAGEIVMATENEKEARNIAEAFISQGKERLIADTKAKLSLDGLFSQIQAGNIKELNLIVKADVQGSVEAVKQSLLKLSNEEVAIRIIHSGVGAVNESDVTLASASNAIIIGFNIRPDNQAKEMADREKVDVRLYRVIYNAIEDVEAAMKGLLDPVFVEKVIGHAEVRQVFKASGLGMIAGSYVLDGKIVRGCKARISREGEQIFEGDLASLKRFKDDVKEVAAGYECGLVFEKFNDLQEFDQIELYVMEEVPR
ncbi:MAG: translation initiation factor IF-2 [Lachnospiraceae bacterium]|nr:translation initiation factor IF-2 [Lachnospiraceae bacterium]